MKKDIFIRKGTTHDAADFANLIVISTTTLPPGVFGVKAGRILKTLFCHRHNLFSFQHCHFIEVGGRNAGMMISYDWRTAKQEWLKTGLLLLKYMKTQIRTRLSILLETPNVLGKIGDGEYYISNLAVYPEHRNLGLGTRLLVEAESEAKKFGTSRVVLEVEAVNQDAVQLYGKAGYTVAKKSEKIAATKETFKFLKLSKMLAPVPRSDAAP